MKANSRFLLRQDALWNYLPFIQLSEVFGRIHTRELLEAGEKLRFRCKTGAASDTFDAQFTMQGQ